MLNRLSGVISRARRSALGTAVVLACTLFWLGGTHAAELVMVESRGCPWCVRWHAEIGPAYPKTTEGRRAPLRRLDISRTRAAGITFAAPVTISPTFVLVDGGREIGRITGYPGPDFFWGLLAELLDKLPKEQQQRADVAVTHGCATVACPLASAFDILSRTILLNRRTG